MSENGFTERIRKIAEEQQDVVRKAREEARSAAEERNKEKARRKVECSTICQRVLLPTMKLFAMGLEAAKVFTSQCWKVDYESHDDHYCCICWARLPQAESSGKAMGIVVKSTLATNADGDAPPKVQVQVKCCQASPGDWKELATLPMSEASETDGTFVDDLYHLNSSNLDEWHKQRLEDCAKACACWLEQHASMAVLNRMEMEVLNRFGQDQARAAK